MKIIHTITAATFMLASSITSAATIWAPTNIDTDFIELGLSFGISTQGGDLAMFDDSDIGFSNPLVIGADGGQVVFTDNNDGSWQAELFYKNKTSGGFITLSGNKNFSLGMKWDGGDYVGDLDSTLTSSPDTYLITFAGDDQLERPRFGNTLAVDLAPIPVPAAVWLFGTGLLGLVAVARRRA